MTSPAHTGVLPCLQQMQPPPTFPASTGTCPRVMQTQRVLCVSAPAIFREVCRGLTQSPQEEHLPTWDAGAPSYPEVTPVPSKGRKEAHPEAPRPGHWAGGPEPRLPLIPHLCSQSLTQDPGPGPTNLCQWTDTRSGELRLRHDSTCIWTSWKHRSHSSGPGQALWTGQPSFGQFPVWSLLSPWLVSSNPLPPQPV